MLLEGSLHQCEIWAHICLGPIRDVPTTRLGYDYLHPFPQMNVLILTQIIKNDTWSMITLDHTVRDFLTHTWTWAHVPTEQPPFRQFLLFWRYYNLLVNIIYLFLTLWFCCLRLTQMRGLCPSQRTSFYPRSNRPLNHVHQPCSAEPWWHLLISHPTPLSCPLGSSPPILFLSSLLYSFSSSPHSSRLCSPPLLSHHPLISPLLLLSNLTDL